MPSKTTTTVPRVSDDAVRTRAYLMWEADGQPWGRDAHYWGLALAELSVPPAAPKPKRAAAARPAKAEKPSKAAPRAKKPKA